jgi:hypothetical protein
LHIRDEYRPIAAFELHDLIVVTKDCMNLGMDVNACFRVGIWDLIMRAFEYFILLDTTQKRIVARRNDGRDTPRAGWEAGRGEGDSSYILFRFPDWETSQGIQRNDAMSQVQDNRNFSGLIVRKG